MLWPRGLRTPNPTSHIEIPKFGRLDRHPSPISQGNNFPSLSVFLGDGILKPLEGSDTVPLFAVWRGKFMRKNVSSVALSGLLLIAAQGIQASASPAPQDDRGTIVIVFRDGHQQRIPLSTITHLEFRSAAGIATPIAIPVAPVPGRGHFLGKWIVGEGNGDSFYITLEDSGEATKSIGAAHGTWTYLDGEARVTWDDGWHDAIRKVGAKHEKFAFPPGKTFSDSPANVTEARNTNPRPI
jgi:hypothetical protein